ncbi:GDSL lipase/esterase - like 10 [Theobroma cacao]|nr:GDSL lipase/esterase - like 10 [Theobroma cacao]
MVLEMFLKHHHSTLTNSLFCNICPLGISKIDLPALYVFGDSYVDNGNNNFLPHSAVANYLPFGIDFDGKPTGRATNGRTVVDFIATVGGFQYPPSILGLSEANRKSTRTGVNYASGSSGILSENGRSMSLLQYLSLKDIKIDSPALYVFGDSYVDDGNNNFLPHSAVANYLPFGIDFDGKPTGRATNGRTVADFIATVSGFQFPPPILGMSEADRKTTQTGVNYASGSSGILSENGRSMRLYKLGARKFLVNNVSPLGCQPFNINTKNHTTSCVEEVNERISIYNKLLSNSLTNWQSTLSGSKFVLGDLYKIFQDVYASPVSYGFKDVNTSCCVDGNGARILPCAQNVAPCEDRKSRVFFDPFHPTESMHFLWARRLLKDSSVCSPINLIQLMQA